jgi:hypothetical protein
MYQDLQELAWEEIGAKWPDKGLFDNHFEKSYYEVQPAIAPLDMAKNEILDCIIKAMQQKLADYGKSRAKTNAGHIGRFFAPIVSLATNFLKFIKFK